MTDEAWCRVVKTKFGTMTFVTTPEVTVSDGSTVVSLHEIPAADRDRWVDDYAAKHAPSPDGLRERVADFIEGIDIDEGGWDGWGRPPQINRDNALAVAEAIHTLYVAHLTSDAAVMRAWMALRYGDIRDAILAALDGEGGT